MRPRTITDRFATADRPHLHAMCAERLRAARALRAAVEAARRGLAPLLLVAALLTSAASGAASGAELEVQSARLAAGDEGYVLNADFAIELGPRLEDIIAHGVPLYFAVEFELTRARWYWFDAVAAAKSRTVRVYYHALTRQYRVSFGALHQSFPTLADALHLLERIRDWQVADTDRLKLGQVYQAKLRMQLDASQFPRPLQVTAIGGRDWSLSTGWFRFDFTPQGAELK